MPNYNNKEGDFRCGRKDCQYNKAYNEVTPWSCSYMDDTGHSKVAKYGIQMPEDCKAYMPNPVYIRKAKEMQKKVTAPENEKRSEKVLDPQVIQKLLDDGIPDRVIADRYNVALSTLRHFKWKNNIHTTLFVAKYDWDYARRLYDSGVTDIRIAAQIGCAYSTVRKWRAKQGLPRNKEIVEKE